MPLRQLTTALCLLAAAAFLVAGCGGSDSDTDSTGGSSSFRLGLEAPLSGEQSVLGKGMLKGAELAVDAAQRERRDRRQGSRDRPDRRRRRSRNRSRSRRSRDRRRPRRHRRPLQLGRRDRNAAALHRRRPGPGQAHLRQLDQRARLHPAADDLPDRAGRLGSPDRLAAREEGRDRLRPDRTLYTGRLRNPEGPSRRSRRHRDRLRKDQARRRRLFRGRRKARSRTTPTSSTPASTTPREA